ncbi:Holliday junction resolvase RuvX [Halieaceae bacterium IMCC14734]|uniref:Putative pre-16S rRNA nuclease n=1 Tax=Candidatus Litorirhabdus singularis TaxID=2518993 RepID=A0ABT3TCN6_9GAMM|nr:Holliday junction resolvase RuvX [Candidatus Litorirhabdus singularis]MCX2980046.1 Holliday junction resolvase RuvX [Candidatus Litorirhabdus singularis]
MAFDYGLVHIGVAIGNRVTATAQPLTTLKARDGIPNWEQTGELLSQWQPQLLLIGLPLNMDGSESELCTRARKFSNRLHGRFDIPVALVDERLSSFDAKQRLREMGHRGDYKASPADAMAAALILETWLNEAAG